MIISDLIKNIEKLLRFVAPGFFATLALLLMIGKDKFPLSFFLLESKPIFTLFSSLLGALIYSIHTGVIYRVIYSVIIFLQTRTRLNVHVPEEWKKYCFCKIGFKLDSENWKRSGSENNSIKSVQNRLREWASMVHFLYCTSYSLILLPVIIWIKRIDANNTLWVYLAGSSVLVFALTSDSVLIKRQFWAVREFGVSVTD